ncbi:sigma-54-dependent Fis family transcriptional regulator [Sporomusa sphaeroides]|uniref:sigma-54-dependent Fis family transcriptional regulator n=1 Tax=Sporomusa sphaeroides TaxID=47679 RepID=UPI00202E6A37|nr:sigma-54-dependent Fis family transcriptional regulator [Sporomusa sphaeroides]MCM0759186.1 sigma-54-dependent Fis family transcriptional regulator [Sporomusa sphaeroides DSM 2875]HML35268.1 sigma-54-dependent Fis family transcriptional regulator [Sporomusa sphaeroides]
MQLSYQAWINYVIKGVPTKDYIQIARPIILNSWRRCREKGLDPIGIPISARISNQELAIKRKNHQNLINVAQPFLRKLYEVVKGSGFVVVLLDQEACIMDLVGDQEFLSKHSCFVVGEYWDDELKGTNAMGLVKVEKKPLQVLANEHYLSCNHWLTCSAAPIYGVDGQVIGIIGVSGDWRRTHAHTLGMVVAAAQAIENQMRLEAAHAEITQSYNNIAAIIESMSDGLISFDGNGHVTQANPLALKILAISEETIHGELDKILPSIADIIEEILVHGRKFNDEEIFFETIRGQVRTHLSGRPIFNQFRTICGGVITLRETGKVHRLVSKIVGAVAKFTFEDIIGVSPALQKAIHIAKTTANSLSSVFLLGESGTGKEMFAQAIHNSSLMASGPFVAINCAAVPRELIESELFGYEEGAFTGAKRGGRPGKFEWANGGTIFLDEIGDMPLETQASLLRVLQEKQVVRIGGFKPIPVNIRVIAATNRDVREEVRKGNLRWDLYYRLNVISITIPPLRERGNDVILLTDYYIDKFSEMLKRPICKVDPAVIEVFQYYTWPGNVRELSNMMERAVNLAQGESILLEHFPELQQLSGNPIKIMHNSQETLGDFQSRLIEDTLRQVDGNIARCAQILGIGRNTLYRKIKKYNIVRDMEK